MSSVPSTARETAKLRSHSQDMESTPYPRTLGERELGAGTCHREKWGMGNTDAADSRIPGAVSSMGPCKVDSLKMGVPAGLWYIGTL